MAEVILSKHLSGEKTWVVSGRDGFSVHVIHDPVLLPLPLTPLQDSIFFRAILQSRLPLVFSSLSLSMR